MLDIGINANTPIDESEVSVARIVGETSIGDVNTDGGLIWCVSFRINVFEKSISPYFVTSTRYGISRVGCDV